MRSVDDAFAAAMVKLPTPQLTRVLQEAVEFQQPKRVGASRPKLRYAHQGGSNPPIIVIHGNALSGVAETYRRYLENRFRTAFKLKGTPLRIEFRTNKIRTRTRRIESGIGSGGASFRLRSFGTAAKFAVAGGFPCALTPTWYRFDLFLARFCAD